MLTLQKVCAEQIFRDAFSDLVFQMSMLFQTIADGLSNPVKFFKYSTK
jgi:hypothetical protein